MSERGGREQLMRRSTSRRSSDTTLPPESRAQLEEKRKQLDDSIHKYIAAKERDYKAFEKELRQQHRTAQGQDGNGRRRASSDASQHEETETLASANGTPISPDIQSSEGADAISAQSRSTTVDRAVIAGLTDRRASLDRDRDFVGLFTPSYLSAIDDRNARDVERIPSLASSVPTTSTRDSPDGIEHYRANSDSRAQARVKRPSHLALIQRTSSSGSSADGKLPSALKSPSQQSKQPKQKRVSLAVGDVIVAPSDSVPAVPGSSNTPSHSRQRSSGSRRVLTSLSRETSQSSIVLNDTAGAGSSVPVSALHSGVDRVATATTVPSPSTRNTETQQAIDPAPAAAKLDPDGDLFDLEELENVPIEHAEIDDLDSASESEEEDEQVDDDVMTDGINLKEQNLRYDSREGLIPEPEEGEGSAVPYLAFQPGSSVASQQPLNPGFRRPSVSNDPVYHGKSYSTAERDAVENEIYGSSFNRPASKGSFTAGSLGESYMAANAAKLEGSRAARKLSGAKG